VKGDKRSVKEYLVKSGLPDNDSEEFADILSSEQPESAAEPFGERAKAWIKKKLIQAPGASWKVGIAVATAVLSKAAAKYYGLG
jgi:hypothetical protein